MAHEHVPVVALPDQLSDQTVAQLVESLYEIARALENHYAGQLHRYYLASDERQQDLWPDNDEEIPV
jgi:hypothetical protein